MRDTCGHVISGTISRAIIRSNMGARDQRVRNHNKIEECGVKFSRIVLNNIVAAAILNNESWSRESWIWSHSSELTQGNVKLGVEFQYFIIPRTKVYRTVQNSALIFRLCSCVELIYVNVLFFLQKSQPGLSHFTLPAISGARSWVSSSQSISSHTCPIILTIIWTISAPHNCVSIKQDLRLCKHWVQLRSFIDRLVQISNWPGHPWYSEEKCLSKHSLQWMLNHECLISEFYYTTSYQQLEYSFVYLYSVTIIHSQRK